MEMEMEMMLKGWINYKIQQWENEEMYATACLCPHFSSPKL